MVRTLARSTSFASSSTSARPTGWPSTSATSSRMAASVSSATGGVRVVTGRVELRRVLTHPDREHRQLVGNAATGEVRRVDQPDGRPLVEADDRRGRAGRPEAAEGILTGAVRARAVEGVQRDAEAARALLEFRERAHHRPVALVEPGLADEQDVAVPAVDQVLQRRPGGRPEVGVDVGKAGRVGGAAEQDEPDVELLEELDAGVVPLHLHRDHAVHELLGDQLGQRGEVVRGVRPQQQVETERVRCGGRGLDVADLHGRPAVPEG